MPVIKEIKLDFTFSGEKNFIYPTLIRYKNELILVDAGYQNMLSKSDLVNFKISNKNDNYYTAVAGTETFVWLYDGDFSNMSAPLFSII